MIESMPVSPENPCFRFAPSPNGRLHPGHAYSALLNARLARECQGDFLVRIEDIDATRCTAELAAACLNDLAWLGLEWKEPVRVQSDHWDDYRLAFVSLVERNLVYPCFCTRREIAQSSTSQDPDGAPRYPGHCARLGVTESERRKKRGDPHSWRLRMEDAIISAGPLVYFRFDPSTFETTTVSSDPLRWGDAVLVRKEIPTSYHLSVVVDDALQGITHIVRGRDLEAATDLHVLLQSLLGLPTPLYLHHELIMDRGDAKLSKSRNSETLDDLRRRGVTAIEIRRRLGFASDA